MRLGSTRVLVLAFAALLAALPAAAATDVILAGSDFWTTPVEIGTHADFATNPIPAGFFCPGSAPFTGKIYFRGEPLATQPTGVLGKVDTIVERLDDAAFDDRGIAHTRLQIRALSLVSTEPLRTSCGSFVVRASLAGEQAVSPHMTIVRERPDSGTYQAAFEIAYKLTFASTRGGRPLELTGSGLLRSNPDHFWWNDPGRSGGRVDGPVLVDTDGDRVADSLVPGTSNFFGNGGTSRLGPGGQSPESAGGLHGYLLEQQLEP